ncbi:hypothetical protein HCUR_00726 [Holospora curviuscula]|uniref:Uncharacterized protein n=1 Tax=Holospora curviuscula TaxID=1082868 RepID=A0A2S5R9Y6_9PROT|nr:hypothetical protein HCUR_00726 [Holospora curviuscula]
MSKIEPMSTSALMGSTLEEIRFLTGFVEVLTYWVEAMFLTNIPENRNVVLNNAPFPSR